MPTYEFQCDRCGSMTEQVFSMSEMPASVACQCGAEAGRRISDNDNVFVRNREYVFDRAKNVRSFAHGKKSDAKHHDDYRKYFERVKQLKRKAKGTKIGGEIEWLGGMPGEMVDSIGQHESDKEAVVKDPIPFLKKTGLYAGD